MHTLSIEVHLRNNYPPANGWFCLVPTTRSYGQPDTSLTILGDEATPYRRLNVQVYYVGDVPNPAEMPTCQSIILTEIDRVLRKYGRIPQEGWNA